MKHIRLNFTVLNIVNHLCLENIFTLLPLEEAADDCINHFIITFEGGRVA